jgi:hypothetical protein
MINLSALKENIDLEIEASKKESPDTFRCGMLLAEIVSEALEQQIAADVVEVVRCKDCAHYIEIPGFVYNNKNAKHCAWHSALRYADNYCSDGWRKENGESI